MFPQRLSAHAVALVVKRYAQAARLDVKLLSGHSLGAGFVGKRRSSGRTREAYHAADGSQEQSIEMVLRYVRQANAFTDNAAQALGL
jgi:hypothetical protein